LVSVDFWLHVDLHRCSPEFQGAVGNGLEALLLAAFVDGSEDVQELPSDWGISSEGDPSELRGQCLCRSMHGEIQKAILEDSIRLVVDANMSMPLGSRCSSGRDSGSAIRD
jgi:hypothetical protein